MQKSLSEIKKYNTFIFDRFEIEKETDNIKIKFYYEIKDLRKFTHKLTIPVSVASTDEEYLKNLVFNIGMLELVSYYKATLADKIIVNCGSLTEDQISFFKKVYYYGLGEFMYLNSIKRDYDTFVKIESYGPTYKTTTDSSGAGSLIAIGGGKDSCVTLSLLDTKDNGCFIINPKPVMLECAHIAGYTDNQIYSVSRIIDKELINLNEEGFLNGHTPFSAMVAFVSYLTAYLNGKKQIVLSNESSANESNVAGTKINHQYSKSYEFESDFQKYASSYLGNNIKYFSLLRPLTEYQIGMLFKNYKKFHKIFKSCNPGSKQNPWVWCCNCPKCLFVYSLLSPHLYKDELVDIFGSDMFENKEMLPTFQELLGKINVKPFDCVGTFEEVNYAITKCIKQNEGHNLPFLLNYYKENYYDETILELNLEKRFNEENSLSPEDIKIVKEAINNDK